MRRDMPLHNFLFEMDPEQFFTGVHGVCTPWINICALLMLARRYRPRRFLEVGTHRGHTTRILADKFPKMAITTVDPGDQVPPNERAAKQKDQYLPQGEIGAAVRDRKNVKVLKAAFENVPWKDERFDMIFLDGNLSMPRVLDDSRRALKLLAAPGVIVWHGCRRGSEVERAIEQIHLDQPVVALQKTWVAYLDTH